MEEDRFVGLPAGLEQVFFAKPGSGKQAKISPAWIPAGERA